MKIKKAKIVGGPGQAMIIPEMRDTPDLVKSRKELDRLRREPMKIHQKAGKLAGIRLKKR